MNLGGQIGRITEIIQKNLNIFEIFNTNYISPIITTILTYFSFILVSKKAKLFEIYYIK